MKHTTVCPKVIRVDKGTENTLVVQCQIAFRLHDMDTVAADTSVRVGSSPTNLVSAYTVIQQKELFNLM